MDNRPAGPSTITSLASAAVSATKASRLYRPAANGVGPQTSRRTASAPVLVLPNPRPQRSSQVSQSPLGRACSGLAQKSQSHCSSSACASVSSAKIWVCSESGRKASNSAGDKLTCAYVLRFHRPTIGA
jgi:hypothetical protein